MYIGNTVRSHSAATTSNFTRERDGELFDLARDPHEVENLWRRPEARPLRAQLQEALLDVLVATEDRSQPREAYW